MTFRGSRLTSVIAALLLSMVTLGTFYVLRDYGPESTIRRFHQAAIADDLDGLARVTEQGMDSKSVSALIGLVRQYHEKGAQIVLTRVTRNPAQVVAEVEYILPQGTVRIDWYVDKTKTSRWVVNADRTIAPMLP